MLEEAAAKTEALGEQRRQEVETAAKRVEALEAHNAVLEEAVAKAEVQGEQQRQKAETAAKRTDYLVAELIEMTNELIEMSKRMAEQMAATDRMRAELDDYRSRSCGGNAWQDCRILGRMTSLAAMQIRSCCPPHWNAFSVETWFPRTWKLQGQKSRASTRTDRAVVTESAESKRVFMSSRPWHELGTVIFGSVLRTAVEVMYQPRDRRRLHKSCA